MIRYRKYFTSTVGFTFLVVAVTGIIFKFFFKNHPLEQIHGWLGIAMVVAACFHISNNWPSLRRYLEDRRVLALLIPIVTVVIGFALASKEERRGINPKELAHRLSHASAFDVAKVLGRDAASVIDAMKADGLKVDGAEQSLKMIADQNGKPEEAILAYFVGSKKTNQSD